jgi:hypothetical protein
VKLSNGWSSYIWSRNSSFAVRFVENRQDATGSRESHQANAESEATPEVRKGVRLEEVIARLD